MSTNEAVDNKELDKAARKAEQAARREAKREATKAAREQAKAERRAAREAKRAEAKALKEQHKAERAAEREAQRMPIQNGMRCPRPGTLCGRAWAIFDEVSARNGSPASIAESLELSRAQKLNDNMVRSNYYSWRKFNGVSGRIVRKGAETEAAA